MWNRTTASALAAALVLSVAGNVSAQELGGKGYVGLYLAAVSTAEGESAVLVQEVVAGGPAEKAGVKTGDRVVSAAGKALNTPEDLKQIVQDCQAGEELELSVQRGEDSLSIKVVLGALPVMALPDLPDLPAGELRGFLGIGFGPMHPAVAAHLDLEEGVGILVGDVWKDSPADKAGLREYDALLSVGGQELLGPDSLNAVLLGKKPGDKVEIKYVQRGERKSVEVMLGERPANLPQVGASPFIPDAQFGRLWSPDHGRRGRVLLKRPDGQEHSFPLPGGDLDVDKLMEEIQRQLSEFGHPHTDQGMTKRLHQLLQTLQKDGAGAADWSKTHSSTTVSRSVNGEYDVTVRDENGHRTVSVKKGDEVLAENLPWDQVKTLPEEARRIVEKMTSKIKVQHFQKVSPTPRKARPQALPKDKSLKA